MKNIILICSLLLSSIVYAQSITNPSTAILELKNGALVVNLIYPTKKIDALLESGQKEESIALEAEVAKDHEQLINAFLQNYNFSQLLFVYSYNMGKLADGDASVLFSASGNAQSLMPANIYFVELTKTKGQSLNGFVVKDKNRDPLAKPFPYFVSMYKFLQIRKRTYVSMVTELNARLLKFYESVNE